MNKNLVEEGTLVVVVKQGEGVEIGGRELDKDEVLTSAGIAIASLRNLIKRRLEEIRENHGADPALYIEEQIEEYIRVCTEMLDSGEVPITEIAKERERNVQS